MRCDRCASRSAVTVTKQMSNGRFGVLDLCGYHTRTNFDALKADGWNFDVDPKANAFLPDELVPAKTEEQPALAGAQQAS